MRHSAQSTQQITGPPSSSTSRPICQHESFAVETRAPMTHRHKHKPKQTTPPSAIISCTAHHITHRKHTGDNISAHAFVSVSKAQYALKYPFACRNPCNHTTQQCYRAVKVTHVMSLHAHQNEPKHVFFFHHKRAHCCKDQLLQISISRAISCE